MDKKPWQEDTLSGFQTKNACADVKAETIAMWYRESPRYDFSSVSGMENLKKCLLEEIACIDRRDLYDALNISPVADYLFYGLPGTGKTYLIGAFIAELMKKGFRYIHLTGADIHSSRKGVAEKTIQIAFQEAMDNAPCLLFVDDIDDVCIQRGDPRVEDHQKRLTVAFLEAYNRLKCSGKQVVFIGATNQPGMVDGALLDKIRLIRVPLPDRDERNAFFKRAFGAIVLEQDFTAEDMAAVTGQYSYRDLQRLKNAVVNKLKARAFRELAVSDENGGIDQARTAMRISEAIQNHRILLDRALFDEARRENPPSDKTKKQELLNAFEAAAR